MHCLCDAPGDRTIGCNANDECALTAEKPHVYSLWTGRSPAFCQLRPKGREPVPAGLAAAGVDGELLARAQHGVLADAVPVDEVGDRHAKHLRDARQRVAAAHLVARGTRTAR